jgi:ribonuclease G
MAASREILFSSDSLEDRAALLENGKIVEIFLARGERMVGNIYKGKIVNVLPGMQAAFVDIGIEKNAFLCLDDALPGHLHEEIYESGKKKKPKTLIQNILKQGQETLVQVVKEPIASKGGRVTTHITLPGKYLILLPVSNYIGISRKIESHSERERLKNLSAKLKPENMGVIIRTAAESKDEKVLKQDIDFLLDLWKEISKQSKKIKAPSLIHQDSELVDRAMRDLFAEDVHKVMVDSKPVFEKTLEFAKRINPKLASRVYYYEGEKPLFEQYGVEAEIEKLLKKKVWLPSGGYLIIDTLEALTVIDVNTGKYVGSHSFEKTVLETNLEAAVEISRQIRLRDLSGIIIVDFIDMEKKENKDKLLSTLEEHLKADRIRTTILGITALGLVEMTRKRSAKNLDRLLREGCFYCSGSGRVLTPETTAIKLERELLRNFRFEKSESVLITAHPQVSLTLAGMEGNRIEDLQQKIGKTIFINANPLFHIEKFSIRWDSCAEIQSTLKSFRVGEEIEVEVQEPHPLCFQNGLSFFNGVVLEILNAGNLIGEKVKVRVKKPISSYIVSEMLH